MINQESYNSLWYGVIDILLDHVEVGDDQSFDHISLGLLA